MIGGEIGKLFIVLGAELTEFDRNMKKAESKIHGFSKNAAQTGQSLTKALTVPLALISGLSLKAAIDFESAFAGVRKTVNATEAEFAGFRKGILDMSKILPASANQIAGVAEVAGQLGVKNSALLGFTRTMIDLGETTDMAANDAASALARLANIMGSNQADFSRMGSSIVQLGNNLATTESEITEMALRLAGAGKQVGFTEAQVLGLAASLSSLGINADAGGTAFSKVLIEIDKSLATGAKSVQTFAAVAGMSVSDFKTLFETDASVAVTKFVEGLGRVEESGSNLFVVMEELGIQERRMVDALLRTSNASNIVERSLHMSAEAWQENIALTEEAEKRYATTASQLKMARNQAVATGIAIGDNLKGALVAVLKPIVSLLAMMEKAAIRFQEWPVAIRVTVGAMLLLVASIGPALIGLAALAKAFLAVRIAAVTMGVTVKKALISTGVGALIVGLGTAAGYIIAEWSTVGPFFERMWNFMLLGAAVAVDMFLALADKLVGWIPGASMLIKAARAELSQIIDARQARANVLEYERLQRQAAAAAQEAADEAAELALQQQLNELEAQGLFAGTVDAAAKVVDVYKQLAEDVTTLANRSKVMGFSFNVASEEVGLLEEAMVQLLDLGVKPSDAAFVALKTRLDNARIAAKGMAKEITDLAPQMSLFSQTLGFGVKVEGGRQVTQRAPEPPESLTTPLDPIAPPDEDADISLSAWFAKTSQEAADWAASMSQAFSQGMGDSISTFFEGLGQLAAGQTTLGNVFKGMLMTLGDVAIRIGRIAIGTGVAMDAIRKAFTNPFTAIAAGVALIALGSWVKASVASTMSGGGGGAGAPTGGGGPITNWAPTIPHGERGGERMPGHGGSGSGSDRRPSESQAEKTSLSVQIVPHATPAGDIEYSVREGRRRADRYGTEVM